MKQTQFAPGGHPKTHPGVHEPNFFKLKMCQTKSHQISADFDEI